MEDSRVLFGLLPFLNLSEHLALNMFILHPFFVQQTWILHILELVSVQKTLFYLLYFCD